MIYFFIFPLWTLVVLFGIILLFFPKLRFLGPHVILASTFATTISFVLSIGLLIGFAGLWQNLGSWETFRNHSDITSAAGVGMGILGYLGGLALGALVGAVIGIAIAWWIDRKLGWSHRPLLQWFGQRIDSYSERLAKR